MHTIDSIREHADVLTITADCEANKAVRALAAALGQPCSASAVHEHTWVFSATPPPAYSRATKFDDDGRPIEYAHADPVPTDTHRLELLAEVTRQLEVCKLPAPAAELVGDHPIVIE